MNEVTNSVSDARAAGAYARAEVLASSLRSPDAVRSRFSVTGNAGPRPNQAVRPQASDAPAGRNDPQTAQSGAGQSGAGLLGGLTNFLVRLVAQAPETQGGAASSRLAGLAAYARSRAGGASGGDAAMESGGKAAMEIVAPSLPRLSSGRTLDLSV